MSQAGDSRDLQPQSSGSEVPSAPGALGSRRPWGCSQVSPTLQGGVAGPALHPQRGVGRPRPLPAAPPSARKEPLGPAPASSSPPSPEVATPRGGASRTPARQVARRPPLTWASTAPRRRLSVTSSRSAATPCPAPARRAARLMLPAPRTAAGRAPWGRGTVGGPGDDPRGLLPAAARVQGQRSARAGGCECSGERSAPTTSPQAPPLQAPPPALGTPRERGLVGIVVPARKGKPRRSEPGPAAAEATPPPGARASPAANETGPRGPQNTRARAGLSRGAPPPRGCPGNAARPPVSCGSGPRSARRPRFAQCPRALASVTLNRGRLLSCGLIHGGGLRGPPWLRPLFRFYKTPDLTMSPSARPTPTPRLTPANNAP